MKLFSTTLSDTNQKIKDSLYDFIDGKYDDIFTKEQIELVIELSFLFNNLIISDTDKSINPFGRIRDISFVYNEVTITQRFSDEQYITEESVFSIFRKQDDFKNCLKVFLRDRKINDILN
jgi:hypothetical protein